VTILTQLFHSALKSSYLVSGTMFGILVAFIIWFNYGTELDRALLGTPPTDAIAASARGDSLIPQEPTTDAIEYRRESVVPDVPTPSIPATPSIEVQMQKLDRDATVARIQKLANDTLKLETDLKTWSKTTSDLTTNDSGRRIASDPASVAAVAQLIQSEPVSADDFALLKSRVRVLEDHALTVSQEGRQSSGLDEAITTTKAMFEKMRQSLDRATLSLASFEKQSQLSKPSSMTLGDAIASDEVKRAAELSSQLAKDKQEAEQRIAAEKRKAAALLNELTLEREREKADADKAHLQAEIDNARMEAKNAVEKRQLEAEFNRDLPQIKHYLGKLFSDGYTQPVSATTYQDVGTHGPVSLGRLKAAGALDDKVEGNGAYSKILHLMVSQTNDRKLPAPYPSDYIGGSPYPDQSAAARPAYGFLRKYGSLLVEKGYLAP